MNCKQSSAIVIDQIVSILNKLPDQSFNQPLDVFNGSTLGQHFRHILDFYHCILKGVEKDRLDYSDRERNLLMEQSTEHASIAFRNMYDKILNLCEMDQLDVIADFSTEDSNDRPVVKSSVGRELMYAYDHAIHHLAIIKIGVKSSFPEISLNQNVGVAPSTIKHHSGNQKHG